MIRRQRPPTRPDRPAVASAAALGRLTSQPGTPAGPPLVQHPQKGRHMARFSLRGRVVAALAGAVAAIAAVPLALVANAPSASAATNQFQGLNWARWGDN